MKNYLLSIVIVSMCYGVLEILKLNSKDKASRLIGSLCLVSVVVWPIMPWIRNQENLNSAIADFNDNMIGSINSFNREYNEEKMEDEFYQRIMSLSCDEIQSSIALILCEKFIISQEDIEVLCKLALDKNSDIHIENVIVVLKNNAIFKNPYEIEEFISVNFNCSCRVRSSA